MTGPLIFDIETHSTNERYLFPPEQFFRIGGVSGLTGTEAHITDSYDSFKAVVEDAPVVIGHNVFAFDLPALGITDLLERAKARRIIDTWALAVVMDPPPDSYQPREGARRFPTKPEQYKQYYSLDNLAFQYGVEGKSHDLKQLAKEHGDPLECCEFGSIPVSNADYRNYLSADVAASRTVLGAMLAKFGPMNDYHWREMQVAAAMSTVSSNGFRLNKELTQERIDANEVIRQRNTQWLIDNYGLPTTNAAGKECKAPLATTEGKRAVLEALYSAGVQAHEIPKTGKGAPSLGADSLKAVAELHPGNQAVQFVVEAVSGVQGLRSVYQTAMQNVHSDGFCHPDIFALQASGRLSTQDPGLTVFGKRGGRHVEREIFVGDVLPHEDDDFHVLFAADFSQIDARGVAALSQDHGYLDMFAPGIDLHAENAKAAFGMAAYEADPDGTRHNAKEVGHGWNYGLGFTKLALKVGEERARAFMNMMERKYPRLVEWKAEAQAEAEAYGVLDNGFGRKMKASRERAYTQGPALKGQGVARDLMFSAILRMDPAVVRMIKALVHDELIFSCPRSVALEVRAHVVSCMTFEWAPPWGSRPVLIEADASKFALNWGQCYAK